MNKLTHRQELAIQEYFTNGGNKTQAYKSAYSTSRMTEKTINENASRLFKNSKVLARIEELQKEIEKRNEINQDDILKELCGIAFYDIRRLFDENNNLKNPTQLDEIDGKVISSIKSTTRYLKDGEIETTTEYKLNNKNTSIDQINKILGFYAPEKKEHSGEITTNIKTLDSFYEE